MTKAYDRIGLLQTFVRIAEAGSISAAARDMGVSQPAASRQLAQLEQQLAVQLLHRTTHSMALTDAGRGLLGDARELIARWESLSERHTGSALQLAGRLKVVAPVALGQQQLSNIAANFQREYPDVEISWLLDDAPIRFSEVGCDCWIRVGSVPDDTLVVRRLASVTRLLVAAPALLEGRALPRTPAAAERYPLVALAPFEGGRIPLARGSRRAKITPQQRMQTNNIFAAKQAVLAGVGMAVMPYWFVDEEIAEGSLVNLLPAWRAPSLDVHVAYYGGSFRPARLRRFIDTLIEQVPLIPGLSD